ncbi:hypothetical protein [Sinomicrobium soli]|uniref:hypothetical protein n=1 Tax=Sinomicrobium sp. N-1-3-6 TaxID=2219864 RepID=UPI000DCD7FE1|nr:hypothetical protein [Sinomicrobium sp. N-1-3-6]RAV27385.1 hypothetical protein DN748_18915 [Sinomicrobium sp. N-1-3-6]
MEYIKKITTFFCGVFFCLSSYSQTIDIKEINVGDSILKEQIKAYIVDTKKRNTLFSQRGYIEVRLLYSNNEAIKDQLKISYKIKDQYYNVHVRRPSEFPIFYGYISDKLVLFYDLIPGLISTSDISKRSRRRLSKRIKPYLKEREHIIAKDSEGNVIINDRDFVDETYNIHGGIILKIYNDGKWEVEH